MKSKFAKITKYVYPVIITEDNGTYLIDAPDLPGLHVFGDTLYEAIEIAREAMAHWLVIAEDQNEEIPIPTDNLNTQSGTISKIDFDTLEYRKATSNKSVTRTVSLPSWLSIKAEKQGLNFSQALQEKLKEQLGIEPVDKRISYKKSVAV